MHLIKGLTSGKTNPIRESMTKVVTFPFTVRVWRDEPLEGDLEQSRAEVRMCILRSPLSGSPEEIIQGIVALPRVSAVEILDADGNGEVAYPDWR